MSIYSQQPVTEREEKILERFQKAGLLPLRDRWREGIDHRPEAEELAETMASIDYLFFGDSMQLEFGADGDNGEILTYILDAWFDLVEAENKENKG